MSKAHHDIRTSLYRFFVSTLVLLSLLTVFTISEAFAQIPTDKSHFKPLNLQWSRWTNFEVTITIFVAAGILYKDYYRTKRLQQLREPKKKVSVMWQIIFSVLPITWVVVFNRIKKLRDGLLLMIMWAVIQTAIDFMYGWPKMLVVDLFMMPPVAYFMMKWSKEWNQRIFSGSSSNVLLPSVPTKRPLGVTIIALIYVILGVLMIIPQTLFPTNSEWDANTLFGIKISKEVANYLWPTMGLVEAGLGLGMFKGIPLARTGAIITEIFGTLSYLGNVIWMTFFAKSTPMMVVQATQLAFGVVLIVSLLIIYYLYKPNARAYFSSNRNFMQTRT